MPKQITVRPTSLEEAQNLDVEAESDNMSVITSRAITFFNKYTVVKFHKRPLILVRDKVFEHYERLTRDDFEELLFTMTGGISKSAAGDVFNYVIKIAPDVSRFGHLLLLGNQVWDSKQLCIVDDIDPKTVVWRSPITPAKQNCQVDFLLEAAKGDLGVYEDILQSMAPIFMDMKPVGVFWWVGTGANGKSSLMDALYRIFPGQLCGLTVKGLTDGRDTPLLNGYLANVVKESSEGKVEDTQIYKSIGTHEDFNIHKFHSQDGLVIRGNIHHIFSANQIPVFNDKGFSARRRTLIIQFLNTFQGDPSFEERTFTPEILGQLVTEILRVTVEIRERQYRYKFSAITDSAKADYDGEANNAETYARSILDDGVVGFDNFNSVRIDYEQWCSDQGYMPLGVNNMRRAIQAMGFECKTVRAGVVTTKRYIIKTVDPSGMREMGYGRRGFYTAPGFSKPIEEKKEDTQMPLSKMGF